MSVISETYGKLVARVRAFRNERHEQGARVGNCYPITRDEYVAAVADMAVSRAGMLRSGAYFDRFVIAYEAYKISGDFKQLHREIGDVSLFGVALTVDTSVEAA